MISAIRARQMTCLDIARPCVRGPLSTVTLSPRACRRCKQTHSLMPRLDRCRAYPALLSESNNDRWSEPLRRRRQHPDIVRGACVDNQGRATVITNRRQAIVGTPLGEPQHLLTLEGQLRHRPFPNGLLAEAIDDLAGGQIQHAALCQPQTQSGPSRDSSSSHFSILFPASHGGTLL